MLMAIRDLFVKAPEPVVMTVDAAAVPAPLNPSLNNFYFSGLYINNFYILF